VRALSDRSRNAALRTVFTRGGKKWFLEYNSKGKRQYRNQAGAKSDVLPGGVLVRLKTGWRSKTDTEETGNNNLRKIKHAFKT